MADARSQIEQMKKIVGMVLKKCTGKHINWDKDVNFLIDLNSIEFISLIVELENVLNIEFDDDKLLLDSYSDTNDFLDYLIYKFLNQNEEE